MRHQPSAGCGVSPPSELCLATACALPRDFHPTQAPSNNFSSFAYRKRAPADPAGPLVWLGLYSVDIRTPSKKPAPPPPRNPPSYRLHPSESQEANSQQKGELFCFRSVIRLREVKERKSSPFLSSLFSVRAKKIVGAGGSRFLLLACE